MTQVGSSYMSTPKLRTCGFSQLMPRGPILSNNPQATRIRLLLRTMMLGLTTEVSLHGLPFGKLSPNRSRRHASVDYPLARATSTFSPHDRQSYQICSLFTPHRAPELARGPRSSQPSGKYSAGSKVFGSFRPETQIALPASRTSIHLRV